MKVARSALKGAFLFRGRAGVRDEARQDPEAASPF